MITISSAFDGGNIEVVSSSRPDDLQLKLQPEPYCANDCRQHYQWYFFRVSGMRGQALVARIVNAGNASFPEAWPGYHSCASYNLKHWFRVPTSYDAGAGELRIAFQCQCDSVYLAYFAPYTAARHAKLVAGIQSACDFAALEVLGRSVQGRELDCLRIGEPGGGKAIVWVVARQHPGESMAEWFMEGLMECLVEQHDGLAQTMRQRAVFYCVPNMNPDGAFLGHLRTNAAGINLNRAWATPTNENSPEVDVVRRKMVQTGCDFFLDVHGDEEFPVVFLAGTDGIPSFTPGMARLKQHLMNLWMRLTPDFCDYKDYYGVDAPGQADLSIGANWVGQHFKCLSLTLEMPFKDVNTNPNSITGWSPQRAKRFGASFTAPLYDIIPMLPEAKQ